MHTNHKCYSLFAIKGHMAGEKESAQTYKQVKMNMLVNMQFMCLNKEPQVHHAAACIE